MTFSSIRRSVFSRWISFCLSITFLTTLIITPQASYAQGVPGLPQPGTMVNLSPAYVPLMITGLTVHPDNPLLMDFIVSTGNSGLNASQVKVQSDRLIKYFLACLTIPENDQWVNLSPYEKQRVIPDDLGQTVLGRDMLAQDYILKQLTASLIYPEKNLGRDFWDKVYSQARQKFGTTRVPVNTFNKVWILPDTAKVYTHNNSVFVVKSHLKVMLDQDYLSLQKHAPVIASPEGAKQSLTEVNTLGNQIVRQIIVPAVEQEVNTGKNFAQLRQIYNSMILAVWFKKNLKEALLNQVYTDKTKMAGLVIPAKAGIQIYQQYLEAYKKGVFNYIKEDSVIARSPKGDEAISTIPRKYFSGGLIGIARVDDSATLADEQRTLAQAPLASRTFDLAVLAQDAGNPMAQLNQQISAINEAGKYRVKIFQDGTRKFIKFKLAASPTTNFTVRMDKGFKVISWLVNGKERLYHSEDLNDLNGGIFTMFPWNNRWKTTALEDIDQVSYDAQRNPIHGLSRISEHWKEISVGVDDQGAYVQASFETSDYPRLAEKVGRSKLTKRIYFSGNSLTIKDQVQGEQGAIADFGEHPFIYYTPGKTKVQIPQVTGIFPINAQYLPTGSPIGVLGNKNVSKSQVLGPLFDNTFRTRPAADGTVTATWIDPERGTTTFILSGEFADNRVIHLWGGSGNPEDRFYGVGAIEPVTTAANGANRQGLRGGSRSFKAGEIRTGTMTMQVTDKAMAKPEFKLEYPLGHWKYWLQQLVNLRYLESIRDFFRDYDYRYEKQGEDLNPAFVFRQGLVWAKMALEKAEKAGIKSRTVLIARDARKANPEIMDALVAAMRYSGLNVIYTAADGPNAVTSYSWAVQQYKPLMSIFHTASHLSRPKDVFVRGFKVAIMDEKGGGVKSLTTKEIKQTSFTAVRELLADPNKVLALRAGKIGAFRTENIDENTVRFNTLVGVIASRNGSLYEFGEALKKAGNPVAVLEQYERRYENAGPLNGLKVVVNGSHTPSGYLTAQTFRRLGATVIEMNLDVREIEGEHTADPSVKKNLAELEEMIKKVAAHFGLSFDLDGDRGAIIVSESVPGTAQKEFHSLAPDNLLGVMLPDLINQWGYKQAGKKLAVIRDVLGTHAVNDKGKELGVDVEQTDAGYVFLKARKQQLEKEGFVVPMYGERSGHTWLHVSGEIENPLAVAVLFALTVKRRWNSHASNPVLDVYRSLSVPYAQSPRFQPLFHPAFLKELADSPENPTSWRYDPLHPTNPPTAIIALGKDRGVKLLQEEFIKGKIYTTSAGDLTVKEFNFYTDPADEGGLNRYADIVFEQNGKFAGRFVFRASSNDPTFVDSYEAPQWKGESMEAANKRKAAIAKLVLGFLMDQKVALVTKEDIANNMPYLSEPQVDSLYNKSNLAPVEADLKNEAMLASVDEVLPQDEEGEDAAMRIDEEFEYPDGNVRRVLSKALYELLKGSGLFYSFEIQNGTLAIITQEDKDEPVTVSDLIRQHWGSLRDTVEQTLKGVSLTLLDGGDPYVARFQVDSAMAAKRRTARQIMASLEKTRAGLERGAGPVLTSQLRVGEGRLAWRLRAMGRKVSPRTDRAMTRGGIDLNAARLSMQSEGDKVYMTFDPAMIAQFKRGDFSGVKFQILDVEPVNLMPLLGLK